MYEPLRRCPAPVFIETKMSTGNSEDAKVQLGVWIAAYHQRLRSIMDRQQPDFVHLSMAEQVSSVFITVSLQKPAHFRYRFQILLISSSMITHAYGF
jgi:hypothetical protein